MQMIGCLKALKPICSAVCLQRNQKAKFFQGTDSKRKLTKIPFHSLYSETKRTWRAKGALFTDQIDCLSKGVRGLYYFFPSLILCFTLGDLCVFSLYLGFHTPKSLSMMLILPMKEKNKLRSIVCGTLLPNDDS